MQAHAGLARMHRCADSRASVMELQHFATFRPSMTTQSHIRNAPSLGIAVMKMHSNQRVVTTCHIPNCILKARKASAYVHGHSNLAQMLNQLRSPVFNHCLNHALIVGESR